MSTMTLTSFPLFPYLPLELQDHIWMLAILPSAPLPTGAYHATLVRTGVHKPDVIDPDTYPCPPPRSASISPGLGSTRFFLHRDGPELQLTPRDALFGTLVALKMTCHRSSLAVKRSRHHLRWLEPKPSLPLNSSPWSAWSLSARKIDARDELVVLEQGWQRPCSLLASATANGGGFDSLHNLQHLRSLRHLGVMWPGPCADAGMFYNSVSVAGLLSIWSELNGLYVVVRPEYLQKHSWPRLPLSINRRRYLSECRRQGPSEKVWVTETREYFEVSMEIVENAGHLWRAMELLCDAQKQTWKWAEHAQNQGVWRPWTRCRVVSWRERR